MYCNLWSDEGEGEDEEDGYMAVAPQTSVWISFMWSVLLSSLSLSSDLLTEAMKTTECDQVGKLIQCVKIYSANQSVLHLVYICVSYYKVWFICFWLTETPKTPPEVLLIVETRYWRKRHNSFYLFIFFTVWHQISLNNSVSGQLGFPKHFCSVFNEKFEQMHSSVYYLLLSHRFTSTLLIFGSGAFKLYGLGQTFCHSSLL